MRVQLFKFKTFGKLFSNGLGSLFEHTFTQLQKQYRYVRYTKADNCLFFNL
mgnify:CR=1 FL=1